MREIQKAYHDIMRSCHPDKNSGENWERANQKSKVLGGIKDILLNKDAKALYDYGGKINGEGKISIDIQQRWEDQDDRTFLMSLVMSSHGELWNHFPPAVQSAFNNQNR